MEGQSQGSSLGSLADSLGMSDQTCNECKRRKGKCDRLLPECSPCARNRRHCLYEKHSRTPLTRKYLTEVEERLKRAEIRARVAERKVSLAEERIGRLTALGHEDFLAQETGLAVDTNNLQTQPSQSRHDEPVNSSEERTSDVDFGTISAPPGQNSNDLFEASEVVNASASEPQYNLFGNASIGDINVDFQSSQNETGIQLPPSNPDNPAGAVRQEGDSLKETSPREVSENVRESTPGMPEGPPTGDDDFSWDENSAHFTPKESSDLGGAVDQPYDCEATDAVDGMGSLSIEDRGAGYLGSSSGAAMLRLLLPDAEHRKSPRFPRSAKENDSSMSHEPGWIPTPLWEQLQLSEVDLDSAIDAYFSLYHLSYPIVHEPTFRAQYAQVIPRPNGTSWNALAFMIGALGLFTTTTDVQNNDDIRLFDAAKSNISIDILERGNITLVQVLTLMSNYLQKRNKPNSGYNYLGLALHTAMGLGLHKEFRNWKISPLTMEIRRRVWWSLYNFYIGALITFGRPLSWPETGVEVAMPLNMYDRDLTNASTSLPLSREAVTTYTLMLMQAKFHRATTGIYSRVISVYFPAAAELLRLDDEHLQGWLTSLPTWYCEDAQVPPKFKLSHRNMFWRFRNLRVIMYRPFVIRNALRTAQDGENEPHSASENEAISRCLQEARFTIVSIQDYWATGPRNRLAAWYALYFLFQACLIPCVCLRNQPASPLASDWRYQIEVSLSVIRGMASVNPSSVECYSVIKRLCADFLHPAPPPEGVQSNAPNSLQATGESPQTQISNVYSMMWPNANPSGVDVLMSDPTWASFMTGLDNDVLEPHADEPPWLSDGLN